MTRARRILARHCFAGLACVGALAGLLEWLFARQDALLSILTGTLLCLLAALAGGFLGFLLLDLIRGVRGREPYSGQQYDGVLMGAFALAFAGMMLRLLTGSEVDTTLGASVGALIGGLLGAFPDELLPPILDLIHQEQALQDSATMPEDGAEPLDEVALVVLGRERVKDALRRI